MTGKDGQRELAAYAKRFAEIMEMDQWRYGRRVRREALDAYARTSGKQGCYEISLLVQVCCERVKTLIGETAVKRHRDYERNIWAATPDVYEAARKPRADYTFKGAMLFGAYASLSARNKQIAIDVEDPGFLED